MDNGKWVISSLIHSLNIIGLKAELRTELRQDAAHSSHQLDQLSVVNFLTGQRHFGVAQRLANFNFINRQSAAAKRGDDVFGFGSR